MELVLRYYGTTYMNVPTCMHVCMYVVHVVIHECGYTFLHVLLHVRGQICIVLKMKVHLWARALSTCTHWPVQHRYLVVHCMLHATWVPTCMHACMYVLHVCAHVYVKVRINWWRKWRLISEVLKSRWTQKSQVSVGSIYVTPCQEWLLGLKAHKSAASRSIKTPHLLFLAYKCLYLCFQRRNPFTKKNVTMAFDERNTVSWSVGPYM